MPKAFIGILAIAITPVAAAADRFELKQVLRPADSAPGDYFGSAVDLQGDLAVIRSRTI